MPTLHEAQTEEQSLTGRHLRWVANKELLGANQCSSCVIRVEPGNTVKPAHSHPNGEELIYIITGSGRVWIEGEISPVSAGSIVLFPQGHVHMLQNNGTEEMKVVCFFSPATDLDNYKMFPEVEFPA
ncbi:MAG: cupin domain-containing protein [Acidobacteriia bacterium]|nr:cupin domain-containing protein [Terriglobia bacterium]